MVLTPNQVQSMSRVAIDIAMKVGNRNTNMFGTIKPKSSRGDKGSKTGIRFNILIELVLMYFKYEYDYGKTTNHKTITVGISRI